MKKLWRIYLLICIMVVTATALTKPKPDEATAEVTAYLQQTLPAFITSIQQLYDAVLKMRAGNAQQINSTKQALRQCRLKYKRVSLLMEYFFPSETTVFNAPPKYEVDEPDMEYQHPAGLQVIEELLFKPYKAANYKALLQQVLLVKHSAEALPALLHGFKATEAQVMESIKLELVRIMALYISGYDAPQLKSGIDEAYQAMAAISQLLQAYIKDYAGAEDIKLCMQNSLAMLQGYPSFDGFERLRFLQQCAVPLQRQLQQFVTANGLQLNNAPALNTSATYLFADDALNKNVFTIAGSNGLNANLVTLGKTLFSETALSGDNTRSCASCHVPGKYFADGLKTNTIMHSDKNLQRNTPTLLYSVFQYSQFWDGRAKTLDEQALTVLHNKTEMNINEDSAVQRLSGDKNYTALFTQVWPNEEKEVSIKHISAALSAYVATLTPFQSPFDKYMRGDTTALTPAQQNGFNIFMGKAACGTCHFIPLFNGLTPPLYNKTEYEVAGTTSTDDFTKPVADTDMGRYNFFPIQFYKKAFKTPTVRNTAVTLPYMHNGTFKTLQKVVEFYNRGGAAGMGLKEEGQTLPSRPLHLAQYEKDCLVAFMQSLTDDMRRIHEIK